MKTLFYIITLFLLFNCSGKEKAKQSTTNNSAKATISTDTLQPPVAFSKITAAKTEAPAGSNSWHYEQTTDQEGRAVYKASITSPNLLEFAFPYAGGSTATLTIRKRANDTHVYIQVSKGQFNRSYQGGNARVRFDGNPAIDYSFSAAENGSANVIFFDSESILINKIKAARKMIVDVEFAGQDKRQIEFQTAGLSWNH